MAIGTRLSNSSRVVRRPNREFSSRSYNLLLRATLSVHFSDAQSGFKAIRADDAGELLPLIQNTNWFFDTELLVVAEKACGSTNPAAPPGPSVGAPQVAGEGRAGVGRAT